MWRPRHLSLLVKLVLPISLWLMALLAVTSWLMQRHAARATNSTIEKEVRGSLQAYEVVWRSRADVLRAVSRVLATMSEVRAAFGTRDRITIQDTAGELWSRVAAENSFFVVADAEGNPVASLGQQKDGAPLTDLSFLRTVRDKFPQQTSGIVSQQGRLFQVVVTPVYVDAERGSALLSILIAGLPVDNSFAARLKADTAGSEFLFLEGGRVLASSRTTPVPEALLAGMTPGSHWLDQGDRHYALLATPLNDLSGVQSGELRIYRDLDSASQSAVTLQRDSALIWLVSIALGLLMIYLLARRILRPIGWLDRAAAEVAASNYDVRVPVQDPDELGRLAETFNSMCASLQHAREELIRKERLATINRLSTSLVHDLRNPLAAIYGGAEMLLDGGLEHGEVRRLAKNIFGASRRVQDLLSELTRVSKGKPSEREHCLLADLVDEAVGMAAERAEGQGIAIEQDVPAELEVWTNAQRLSRVFLNLIENAIEAMPDGGWVRIVAVQDGQQVLVRVEDNGPGLPAAVRERLFQPFVTAGKRHGLGLGLALARETLREFGGDLWADTAAAPGTRLLVRLPVAAEAQYEQAVG